MEKLFLFLPEGHNWRFIHAASAQMAYRAECCWYDPGTKIAVMDAETGQTVVFTRKIDAGGNMTVMREVNLTNDL